MINLEIRIGSRPYQITCREGQEAQNEPLTKIINEKIATAESALGSMSETRLLMFATLLLADEINDTRGAGIGRRPRRSIRPRWSASPIASQPSQPPLRPAPRRPKSNGGGYCPVRATKITSRLFIIHGSASS